MPGESTLRRDFIRLQQENKERSEALRRQQLLQEQQLREQEEYKRQLLAERQKRIEQQKEQRRRLEEVSARAGHGLNRNQTIVNISGVETAASLCTRVGSDDTHTLTVGVC